MAYAVMVSVRRKTIILSIANRVPDAAYLLPEFQATKMGSEAVNNITVFSPLKNKKTPRALAENNSSKESNISTTQTVDSQKDSNTPPFPLYEENFLLEAIDKIIKKRWRIIGRTTRYGWLAACSYKRTVSPEDAKILYALGNKIGFEHSTEAIERIENLAQKLHPRDVPTAAIAVLTETQTALMLRQRRGSKSSTKLVKDRFPTIFTISDACTTTIKRTEYS